MKMKKKTGDILFIFIGIIGIAFITLINIGKLNNIRVVDDEFGYWLDATAFTEKNWAEVGSLNSYYSYGYSLFLVPIVKYISDPVLAYKLGIGINVIFMVLSYLISIAIGKKVYPDEKIKTIVLASFVMELYPTLIILSQHTVGECMQYFMYWMVCFFVVQIIYTSNFIYLFGMDLCMILLYVAHMRNLGVVLVGLIFQIVFVGVRIIEKKIDKERINRAIIILIGGLLFTFLLFQGANELKKYVIENCYGVQSGQSVGNDYGGQIEKIKAILNGTETLPLVQNIIGLFFYSATSTMLIPLMSVWFLGKHFQQIWSHDEYLQASWKRLSFHIFLLVALLSEIGVAAVFLIGGVRLNSVVYGRYYEQVICPLIFFTILELKNYDVKLPRKVRAIFILFYICMGIFTYKAMLGKGNIFYVNTAPVMGYISYKTETLNSPKIAIVTLEIIIICLMFLMFIYNIFKRRIEVMLIFLSVFWCTCSFFLLKETVYANYEKYQEVKYIADEINESDITVYFVNEVEGAIQFIDYLQFYLWDKEIHVIKPSDVNSISEGYIVAYKYTDMYSYLQEEYPQNMECQWFSAFLIEK